MLKIHRLTLFAFIPLFLIMGALFIPSCGGGVSDELQLEMISSARYDNTVRVIEILDMGANPNYVKEAGWSALHFAAMRGNVELVHILLDAGANINVQNDEGYTPLMAAAQNGETETVRVLLDAGADPSLGDISGITALDFAERDDYTEIINLLSTPR